MTFFPDYLKTYPNMDSAFPLHMSLNTLKQGFRAHRHDFLEFSYVVEGRGRESINDVKHEMLPGTFTFVQPYQVHEIFTEPGSTLVLYNCNFSMDLLIDSGHGDGLSDLIEPSLLEPYTTFTGAKQERMLFLIEDMLKEYTGNEPWRQTLLQARLKELLVCFDRERRANRPENVPLTSPAKTNPSIWPIIHHIHRNYRDELTLSQLSDRFGMSVSRISEVIKETTGQTFVHFVQDLRLRHATSLLVSTDFSVVDVALEVGFGSYKTFVRIFRERKGMVPMAYRKAKRPQ
ncbi:helix-turn-helix domain-containing protein [Paenibacillus lignilyticus]|uniref:Helix-turn-helix transcriptional regulator n=1 Tax=Paenibacillus lignilyticus TaxID=1172615 RepID=A0ABS5CJY6_9BACL|nr:AraC family transcriptional regulator [Paenibacillus lignilyticus]MBP3966131.1 helix-turn-helix transcriptional regulator [Paenibacillus lignilyticus]